MIANNGGRKADDKNFTTGTLSQGGVSGRSFSGSPKYDAAALKRVPVSDVLLHYGLKGPDLSAGKDKYFSPFRDEAVGSFSVRSADNLWYDHGFGVGGDVIQLVALIEQGYSGGPVVVSGREFVSACRILSDIAEEHGQYVGFAPETVVSEDALPVRNILDSVQPLSYFPLVDYLESRCIPLSLAERYCCQVEFHSEGSTARKRAIGTRTLSGYEAFFRPFSEKRRNKYSVGHKSISLFGKDGSDIMDSADPTSRGCVIFESTTDFLSWMRYTGRTVPGIDVVILHSTTNIVRALDFVRSHGTCCFLCDNDNAGNNCLMALRDGCSGTGVKVVDSRMNFLKKEGMSYKDVNEMLQGETAAGRFDGKLVKRSRSRHR